MTQQVKCPTHCISFEADIPLLAAATPWKRLMSILYDSLLCLSILLFFGYIFSVLTNFKGDAGSQKTIFQILGYCISGAYYTGFWYNHHQSLAMKTLSLKISTTTGKPLCLAQSLFRFIVISILCIISLWLGKNVHPTLYSVIVLSFLWTIIDPRNRSLHDIISGTQLCSTTIVPDKMASVLSKAKTAQ